MRPPESQTDERHHDAGGIDGPVGHCSDPALDERLMKLIARRVGGGEQEHGPLDPQGAPEQERE